MSLEDIREKKQSKGLYIVIGLLLLGMAGFGTSQFGTGGGSSPQVLLSADNSEIMVYEYEDALRRIQRNNPDLEISQAQKYVISGLKERLALAEHISKYPFAASNQQVDNVITSNMEFYENGKFSEDRFRELVKTSPEAYRRGISKSIAMQDFQKIIATTTVTSDAEVQPFIDMQNVSRDITVAKLPASLFKASATAEEVQKYYEENTAQFMTDEEFNLEYIDFNPADIVNAIEVDDVQIMAQIASTREASYHLFKDAASAKAAYEKIKAGETLESVKTAMADSIEDSDALGELSSTASNDNLLPQNAIDAIFALSDVGEVTVPLIVDGSSYLFELTNKKSPVVTDESKAAAKKHLQAKLAKPLVEEAIEKLNKAVEESAPTLQSINEATGLSIQKSGLLMANSQKGILAIPEMLAAINKSDKALEKLQEPVIVGDRVIIYKIAELKESKQKTFDDVKEQAEQLLVIKKTADKITEAAKKLQEEIKNEGLVSASQKAGYSTKSYVKFDGRVQEGEVLDQIAALMILRESPKTGNDNASVIASPLGDSYVYVTDSVSLESDSGLDEKAKQQLTSQLNAENGVKELSALLQSIVKRTKIIDNSAKAIDRK